ncbi:hypothetical protein LSTR_LSTR003501 [Laodelphax striatellus]|uniref:Uncharacterized protein n=1 Tax=Laodelphax striatellus TaxID=195883 RepID=A0A482WYU0_LAOST|nr:hypothetical protein LSTR_LSTR003501 [Laodelphax striatellus]
MPPFCMRGPHSMAEAPDNNNSNLASLPNGSNGLLSQAFPLENSLPQLLMSQSGVAEEELSTRRSLRLRVVARDMSLQRLSIYTPALRELDLSGSCLTSLRDLGCNLRLEVLCVRRCGLDSLDGASGLALLRQLDASHNAIRDIGPCAMLPHIQRIDLTNNSVNDLSQVGFLSLCGQLRHLTLTGCPLAVLPLVADYQQQVASYRQQVVDLLPELQTLDGQPLPADGLVIDVDENERKGEEENEEKGGEDSDVDTESKAVDDEKETEREKKEGELVKMKFTKQTDPRLTFDKRSRPATSTGLRSSSLLADKELLSAKNIKYRPQSAGHPNIAKPEPEERGKGEECGGRIRGGGEEEGGGGGSEEGETSRLTSGVIVCGNLTAALKKRNRKTQQKNAWTTSCKPVENNELEIKEADNERSKDIDTLLTASKKWRTAFAQYRQLNGMEIDNIVLLRLQAGSVDDIKDVLKNITEKNAQRFRFEELNESERRKKLWSLLFHHLNKSSSAGCHRECLSAIKMLSRDETDLEVMMSDERHVDTLLMHAGLFQQDQLHDISDNEDIQQKFATILEAQKALCNLLFNSKRVQEFCCCNRTIESVVTRLRLFNEPTLPHDVKMFDIKILFLITALSPEARPKLKDELHGMLYLVEILDSIMKEASVDDDHASATLTDTQVSIVIEVLKVLFNIMLKSTTTPQLAHDEDDTAQFMKLQLILKSMLLCKTTPEELIQTLHNHVVNLLTLAPNACHRELISTVSPNDNPRGHEFNGKNMEAVAVLIDFLDKRLNQVKKGQCSDTETLCPILSVLIECAKSDSALRKYVRAQILPPLRDVKTRPEQGDKLRNKLCRLLTCPVTNVRDLVAELLFVLCKESVARMIKYTGYGNAAGMFADRGLLGCRAQQGAGGGAAPYYSSDSDDSETEEYSAYKDRINQFWDAMNLQNLIQPMECLKNRRNTKH